MPGPVPKRGADRVRRNPPIFPVSTVQLEEQVSIPPLDLTDPHPLIEDFYNSLKTSGQALYYEPSDWQVARLLCYVLNDYLNRIDTAQRAPSAQMLSAIQSMLSDLMTTEGARRRLRLEVERGVAKENKQTEEDAQIIAMYQQMMTESVPVTQ